MLRSQIIMRRRAEPSRKGEREASTFSSRQASHRRKQESKLVPREATLRLSSRLEPSGARETREFAATDAANCCCLQFSRGQPEWLATTTPPTRRKFGSIKHASERAERLPNSGKCPSVSSWLSVARRSLRLHAPPTNRKPAGRSLFWSWQKQSATAN